MDTCSGKEPPRTIIAGSAAIKICASCALMQTSHHLETHTYARMYVRVAHLVQRLACKSQSTNLQRFNIYFTCLRTWHDSALLLLHFSGHQMETRRVRAQPPANVCATS